MQSLNDPPPGRSQPKNEYEASTNGILFTSETQEGPIPESALRSRLENAELPMDVLVWCETLDDWMAAREVPNFKGNRSIQEPPGGATGYPTRDSSIQYSRKTKTRSARPRTTARARTTAGARQEDRADTAPGGTSDNDGLLRLSLVGQ